MNDGIDKQALYGKYQESQDWKSKLYRAAAHKALDIADDDMSISNRTNSTNQTGLGAAGAIALAAVAGSLPVVGALATYLLLTPPKPALPAAPPPASAPADSEYSVRFFDKDGNLIDVPHLRERRPP